MLPPTPESADIDTLIARAAARTPPRGGAAHFVLATAVTAVAAGLLASVDPNEGGHYPTCPFLAITGFYCPGCGTLRACHALLHLDPVTAWERNPLLIVALPLMVASWVMWGLRVVERTTWSTILIPPSWLWAAIAVIVSFWILRNVPGWTVLSPA